MVTVPSEDTWVEYDISGSASTGPFTFDFPYFAKADLDVRVNGTRLTTSQFTLVDGAGSATAGYDGGSITLGSAAAVGAKVSIARDIAPARTSNLTGGGMTPTAIDAALNYSVMLHQEHKRDIDRSFKFPVDEDADFTMASATARASKFYAFDANGDPTLYANDSTNALLTAIGDLTPTDGVIIVGNGTTWVGESGATARTSLGLGTGNSPNFTGISLGASATFTALLDEDDMSSDSATALASQQSIKAFVTSGTVTFTNKQIDLGDNGLSGTIAQFNSACLDANFATLAGTEEFTNKTLTSPTINGGTITGITDIAVADGGTGASASGAAKTNLRVSVANIAALTALTKASLADGETIYVQAHTSAGDAGGGWFRWDSSSTDTEDLIVTFESDESGTGRFIRVITDRAITPEMGGWFIGGAITRDRYNQFIQLTGAYELVLGAGQYIVTSGASADWVSVEPPTGSRVRGMSATESNIHFSSGSYTTARDPLHNLANDGLDWSICKITSAIAEGDYSMFELNGAQGAFEHVSFDTGQTETVRGGYAFSVGSSDGNDIEFHFCRFDQCRYGFVRSNSNTNAQSNYRWNGCVWNNNLGGNVTVNAVNGDVDNFQIVGGFMGDMIGGDNDLRANAPADTGSIADTEGLAVAIGSANRVIIDGLIIEGEMVEAIHTEEKAINQIITNVIAVVRHRPENADFFEKGFSCSANYVGDGGTSTSLTIAPRNILVSNSIFEYENFHDLSAATVTMPNGGTAANLYDGDIETEGTTTTNIGVIDPYVVFHIDFGAAEDVVYARLRNVALSTGLSRQFFLQYSSDNSTWTSVTSLAQQGIRLGTAPRDIDIPVDVSARYWRLARISNPVDISSITLNGNDPVQVDTSASHFLVTGDTVAFADVGGTTELNGNTYTVTRVDADTITLDGTDSANFTAYTSGGTVSELDNIAGTVAVGNITFQDTNDRYGLGVPYLSGASYGLLSEPHADTVIFDNVLAVGWQEGFQRGSGDIALRNVTAKLCGTGVDAKTLRADDRITAVKCNYPVRNHLPTFVNDLVCVDCRKAPAPQTPSTSNRLVARRLTTQYYNVDLPTGGTTSIPWLPRTSNSRARGGVDGLQVVITGEDTSNTTAKHKSVTRTFTWDGTSMTDTAVDNAGAGAFSFAAVANNTTDARFDLTFSNTSGSDFTGFSITAYYDGAFTFDE